MNRSCLTDPPRSMHAVMASLTDAIGNAYRYPQKDRVEYLKRLQKSLEREMIIRQRNKARRLGVPKQET